MSVPVVVNAVRRDFYLDSVALMRVSALVSAGAGVEEASLMIGSPANKGILEHAGLLVEEGRKASPADLVIAVRAVDSPSAAGAVEAAREALESMPTGAAGGTDAWRPRTIEGGLRALPGATLALVSVPGEHAAAEAHRALGLGLDVMIFSDNVPLDAEVGLKRRAHALGRLVMGPDCGTAILSGVPLAFANAVPRGDVGVVSASGTGLQELSVLLAREGAGLSHGIGVGGRDLGEAVGGLCTLDAIDLLAADPATASIVLVSKPPASEVAARVLGRLAATGKPAVACFIGAPTSGERAHGVALARTVHEAAERVLGRAIGADFDPGAVARQVASRRAGVVRGLFSGGTLCAEAQAVLAEAGLAVSSNAPIPGASALGAAGEVPEGHVLLDLGADEYTRGRPHPMLDPAVRAPPLREALADPRVGVVLLDVVLGYGAHEDPAGAVATVIAEHGADRPPVVASVCGVDGDPQDLAGQRRALEDVGVAVAPSNARAAALACALAQGKPR
jgi:FdrA protein